MIRHSRPSVTDRERDLVGSALQSEQLHGDLWSRRFSASLRQWLHSDDLRVTRSGTSALALALSLLNSEGTGEVVIPTYVCGEVESAVKLAGFVPAYADVTELGLLEAEQLERCLNAATRAVVLVHTFGHLVDVQRIRQLVADRSPNCVVIEDCCHAFGIQTTSGESLSESFAYVFSLGATKCLTAGGAGGAVLCSRDAADIREEQGRSAACNADFALSGVECAFGIAQLERYESMLERRRRIQEYYDSCTPHLVVPSRDLRKMSDLFRYVVHTNLGFETASSSFATQGIAVRRGVDTLLHRQASATSDQRFPIASQIYEATVSVPFYPALSDDEVVRVGEALRGLPA